MSPATFSPAQPSQVVAPHIVATTNGTEFLTSELFRAQQLLLASPMESKRILNALIPSGASTPLLAEIYLTSARASYLLSDYDGALRTLDRARAADIPTALAHQIDSLTADCYQQLERFDEAIAIVEQVMPELIEEQDAQLICEFLNTRALCELHLGRTAEALRHAKRGLDLSEHSRAAAINGRLLCTTLMHLSDDAGVGPGDRVR